MNELRSTDILDKEIQEDARKKAERILSQAKNECEKILNSVDLRIEEAKNEREKKSSEKLKVFEKDQESALPLEKERFLITYIQTSINNAINEYVESLSEDEKFSLVLSKFDNYKEHFSGKKVNAFVYGFDISEAKKRLEKMVNIQNVEKTDFNKIIIEEDLGIKNKKGIILESADKSVRCRLTLSEIFSEVENEYREEMAEKLGM